MVLYPSYWHRFFSHIQKDIKVFLFLTLLLVFFRIVLIAFFSTQIEANTSITDFFLCFYRGLGFDGRVASSLLLPNLILALFSFDFWSKKWDIFLNKFRLIISSIFITLTVFLSIINIGFFKEYHDQFNHWIFGLLLDDQVAIFKTIWQNYPIFTLVAVGLIFSCALLFVLKKYIQKEFINTYSFHPHVMNIYIQILITILSIGLFVGALRGSFGRRPLQNIDISITKSSFLNKTILNPYFAIAYATYDYRKAKSASGLRSYWPNGNIQEALTLLNPNIPNSSKSLLDYIEKKSPGTLQKPSHVFLIIMESQDSWPFLDAYKALGLNRGLDAISQEGIRIKASVSASSGTMTSLSTLITGCPYAGIYPNYHSTSKTPYPTAIAPIFKSLGYQVNFFYAGYLSWQRIEEFCKNQGFDFVYGGSLMGKFEDNEWGVPDEQLFDFILKKIEPNVPSLNVILTTSNHPPYDIDLKGKNCPITSIPESMRQMYDGHTPLHILAHTWYGDQCASQFIRLANKQLPNALFAVTGDHWSRRFIHQKPSLYEQKSVPLILYGPNVLTESHLNNIENLTASHTDILPTIIHLCAPKNFTYFAFGEDIWLKKPPFAAFGANAILTPNYIFLASTSFPKTETLPFASPENLPDVNALVLYHQALHAASWWLLMKGPSL